MHFFLGTLNLDKNIFVKTLDKMFFVNYIWTVNKKGIIAYRSEWNDPNTVEKVLLHLENPKSEKLPRPKAKMPSPFTVLPSSQTSPNTRLV